MSINLKNLKNKNIHIVGIGSAEGSAAAEFLVAQGIENITGHDFSEEKDFEKTFNNTHLSLKSKERKEALDKLLNLTKVETRHCLVSTATAPIKINFKKNYLKDIEKAEVVFVSQVWFKYSQNLPILQDLKDKGISFKTITNLYFELAPCPIIGITGTNGKTTTARLINNIFEIWAIPPSPPLVRGGEISPPLEGGVRGGIQKIYFAGNDRQNVQVLDKLPEMTENDVLILEISSTQLLLNSEISPHTGVITNITPNHLDDHGSFENYIEAKKNLVRYQGAGDWAVLNWDDVESRKFIESIKSKVFLFSRKEELEEGCFVRDGKIVIRTSLPFVIPTGMNEGRANGMEESLKHPVRKKLLYRDNNIKGIPQLLSSLGMTNKNREMILFSVSDIKLIGKHNLENVLSAVSAAFLYGVDLEIIKEGIISYAGTKHRLKLLYNINGVRYYDDTQATTPEATISGLDSFDGEIILIAGGDNKGMDYQKLAEKINGKVKLLILFPGNASDEIEKFVDKNKIGFARVNSFSEAADFLKKYLKNKKTPSVFKDTGCLDVVLISPAAAHFYSKFVEGSGKSLKEWCLLISKI